MTRHRACTASRVAVFALVALVLAGCAGGRNVLNTSASTCFRGLPAASAAVGPKAKLVGVRSVRRAELVARIPAASRIAGAGSVCAIAYRANFTATDVPGADPRGPGAYALVALDSHGSTVLATFVLDDLPLRFNHRT